MFEYSFKAEASILYRLLPVVFSKQWTCWQRLAGYNMLSAARTFFFPIPPLQMN
jgi:hypothetical protein